MQNAGVHAFGAFAGEGFFREDIRFDAHEGERDRLVAGSLDVGRGGSSRAHTPRAVLVDVGAQLQGAGVAEQDGFHHGVRGGVFSRADVDLENFAVARGGDEGEIQIGLRLGEKGLALLEFGGGARLQGLGGPVLEGGAAHLFLAGDIFRAELGDAVEQIFFLGEVGLRFGQACGQHGNFRLPRGDSRPRRARIDAEERVAFLHLIPNLDEDLLHHAADQRRNMHVFPEGLDDPACPDGGLIGCGSGLHEGRGDRIGFLQTRDEEKHGRDSKECGGDGDVSKHCFWVAAGNEDGRGGNPTRSGTR